MIVNLNKYDTNDGSSGHIKCWISRCRFNQKNTHVWKTVAIKKWQSLLWDIIDNNFELLTNLWAYLYCIEYSKKSQKVFVFLYCIIPEKSIYHFIISIDDQSG